MLGKGREREQGADRPEERDVEATVGGVGGGNRRFKSNGQEEEGKQEEEKSWNEDDGKRETRKQKLRVGGNVKKERQPPFMTEGRSRFSVLAVAEGP